jgi:hypothetical protein
LLLLDTANRAIDLIQKRACVSVHPSIEILIDALSAPAGETKHAAICGQDVQDQLGIGERIIKPHPRIQGEKRRAWHEVDGPPEKVS